MLPTVVLLAPQTPGIPDRLRHLEQLAQTVGEVHFTHVDVDLPLEQTVTACGDTRAILLASATAQIVPLAARLPGLKLVQIFSAGSDWLDVAGLAAMGAQVADNGGANAVPVAEHAIALMLSLCRRLEELSHSIRAGDWHADFRQRPGAFQTLAGKRVGIVGLGRIGSRVARRLTAWECECVFHDIRSFDDDDLRSCGARPLPFDELLATSDIVTVHVPLNHTTRHMVGHRELGLMRPESMLINTCRGPVVDETALICALRAKRLGGAGLDVFEVEPIAPDNQLLQLPGVVLTPHLATMSPDSGPAGTQHAATNTARVALGQEPTAVVEPV
jgi:phosphoglycerate dehydrogenase-like enzyme